MLSFVFLSGNARLCRPSCHLTRKGSRLVRTADANIRKKSVLLSSEDSSISMEGHRSPPRIAIRNCEDDGNTLRPFLKHFRRLQMSRRVDGRRENDCPISTRGTSPVAYQRGSPSTTNTPQLKRHRQQILSSNINIQSLLKSIYSP